MTLLSRLSRLMLIAVLLTVLGGCEYLGLDERESPQVEQVPVSVEPLPSTSSLVAADSMAATVPVPAQDYATLTRQQTDGSVQLFSLEDEAAPASSGYALGAVESSSAYASTAQPQGVPFRGDPNVTVFPMGSEGSVPGVAPAPSDSIVAMGGGSFPMLTSAPEGPSAGRIYFRHGSSRLGDLDRAFLAKVADSAGNSRLVILEGHASPRTGIDDVKESHIANLKMSMKRVLAIAQELIRRGVPAENIRTSAMGDIKPAAQVDPSKDNESQQRRVEIYTQ